MNSLRKYIPSNTVINRQILAVLLFCFGMVLPALAQDPTHELKRLSLENPLGNKAFVSLLTASPGNEVYSQYGHTAIRVCDSEKGFDLVFNYGLFDFNSPDFLWRFVKGETDYVVGPCSYTDFLIEYQVENRAVTEQVINLKPQEKEAVWQALVQNIQPENRTYRYNFFFNNCSTKPRDILLKNITGKVNYQWGGQFKSLRDEIHFYTKAYPWTQFGIDLLIGAPADDSASLKAQQFAPEILMKSFSKAVVLRDSAQVSTLVLETSQPVTIDQTQIEKHSWMPGPNLVMWVIFAIVACLSFLEFKKRKRYHALDAILFTVTGLIGTIITFMVLFSEHPTTNVNYLLIWMHPAHLIYAAGLLFPVFRNKAAAMYLSINLPFQLFALAGILFLPQHIHPAMYPVLLSLMLRSGLALFSVQKKYGHA